MILEEAKKLVARTKISMIRMLLIKLFKFNPTTLNQRSIGRPLKIFMTMLTFKMMKRSTNIFVRS